MKFKCPVCGLNKIEVVEMEHKRRTDLVRCLGCGELLEYTKSDAVISIMQKSLVEALKDLRVEYEKNSDNPAFGE